MTLSKSPANAITRIEMEFALLETGSSSQASARCGVNAASIRQHLYWLRKESKCSAETFPVLQIQHIKNLALQGLTDLEIAAQMDGHDVVSVNLVLDRWQGLQARADDRKEKLAAALAPAVAKPVVIKTLEDVLRGFGVHGLTSIPPPVADELSDEQKLALDEYRSCADR